MFPPRKINKSDIKQLSRDGAAFYNIEYGFIGTKYSTEVIIQGRVGYFLADIKDFECTNISELKMKPKPRLLLAIGGLPPTEAELLARDLDVTVSCATSVLYLRGRHRWSQALESELIRLYDEGNPPANMDEFGVTAETQAKLFWSVNTTLNKI